MRIIITGVAGFIASHLAEVALADGHDVLGIDNFSDYYPRTLKEANIAGFKDSPNFRFIERDLLRCNLTECFAGHDILFHLAAQPGVRASWGDNFKIYTDTNILGTQKVLEAAREAGIIRVVYASSSSVYGDVDDYPMRETTYPRPISPYGVSKLAGENLCVLYTKNYHLSTVSLRYFTVYGPRQRPDMAFHKFGKALLEGKQPVFFGNGEQTRDFTYVTDAVAATYSAAWVPDINGMVFNIGGGSRVSINDVVQIIERLTGKRIEPIRQSIYKGDVRHTAADTTLAHKYLGFSPKVSLQDGLANELDWLATIYPNFT